MLNILLIKQDYETLKSILTIIDPVLQNKIDDGKQKANKYVVTVTLNELESLAEYIAAEANHEEDKIRQRKLDRLCNIVNAVLERQEWKEKLERMPGELRDEISDQ